MRTAEQIEQDRIEHNARIAAQQAKLQARSAEQADVANAMIAQLPVLSGTPKQVAWAEEIRGRKLYGFGPRYSRTAEIPEQPMALQEELGFITRIESRNPQKAVDRRGALDALIAQDSAAFWIDNRSYELSELLRTS